MSEITVRSVLAKFGFKVDDASLKKANKTVDEAKRNVEATEKEFGKLGSAAELGFGRTERVAKSLGTQLGKTAKEAASAGDKIAGHFTGAFKGAFVANVSMEGIKKLGEFMGEAVDRVASLDAAMERLPLGIDDAAAATRGLVSNFSLATSGAGALRAGLVSSTSEFNTFAGDVARLAQAAGDDVGTSVERMVEELKGGSTALLEQYGVTVDAEAAVTAFAEAHHRLAEDLSDTEKRQAVATAAMEAMRAKAAALGPVIETNATRLQRARAKLDNLTDGLHRVAVTAAGEAVGAFDSVSEALAKKAEAATRDRQQVQDLAGAMDTGGASFSRFGQSVLDTAADLTIGRDRIEEIIDAAGRLGPKLSEAAAALPEVYQPTQAELRAQKAIEQELQAHEDAAARERMKVGPSTEDWRKEQEKKKRGGARKPGVEYFFNSRSLADSALGGNADVAELLAGYRGKTAKQKALDEVYREMRRDPTKSLGQHLEPGRESETGRHFLELLKGGSPAGEGGPNSAGAAGLGTRIVNIDAHITAEITVPAPEGLVDAGEVQARRVAQDLGRGIAEELDPYFAAQADVLRKVVEG